MSLLKNLTIKISSTEERPSSDEQKEKEEPSRWCIKCPFPDDDVYTYVMNEDGLFEGQLKQFYSEVEAEHYIAFHELKNCTIEKI